MRRRGLERVPRGVDRLPAGAVPPEQALRAAVLRCGRGARAAGESACALLVQPADRATVRGVPSVSAARALIDVAARVDERRLRAAIDSARRAGL